MICGQALENQEPRQTQCPLKASFEDGWIDLGAVQLGPVDFKIPMRILGEAVLIRRASTREINMVDLGNKASQCSRGDVNLFAIVGSAGSIDIKTSEDFTD